MVEHKDISLWEHDFRTELWHVNIASKSIRRIRKKETYEKLDELANRIEDTYKKIRSMSDEIFIELKRVTKEQLPEGRN